jgi:hypothetical protein
MRSGCAECKGYGSAAGFFGVIDADRAAQLLGGVLDLAEVMGEGAVEVDTGVSEADRGVAFGPGRFNVDTFVLGAVNGPVEEVPEDEGE